MTADQSPVDFLQPGTEPPEQAPNHKQAGKRHFQPMQPFVIPFHEKRAKESGYPYHHATQKAAVDHSQVVPASLATEKENYS